MDTPKRKQSYSADVLLPALKKIRDGTNVREKLHQAIEQLESLGAAAPTTLQASAVSLEQVRRLFGVKFNVTDLEDLTFGYTEETAKEAWGIAGGRRVSAGEIEVSQWLDTGIEKVDRNTALYSHESAVRSVINLVLIETLDVLQNVTSIPTPVDAQRQWHQTHPVQALQVDDGHHHLHAAQLKPYQDPEDQAPPLKQQHPPIRTFAASSLAPTPTTPPPPRQTPTPSTPTASSSTFPTSNLQLFYETPISFTVLTGDSNGKPIKIVGKADYTIGYDTRHAANGSLSNDTAGFLIAVEAKRAGTILNAIPQCLTYMAIISASRAAAGKNNSVVYGICSSGFDFLLLRLDNDHEVIRSQVFNVKRSSQRKMLIKILVSVFHAARASSPQTTPYKDSATRQNNILAFKDASKKELIDFGVDDWINLRDVVVPGEADEAYDIIDFKTPPVQ